MFEGEGTAAIPGLGGDGGGGTAIVDPPAGGDGGTPAEGGEGGDGGEGGEGAPGEGEGGEGEGAGEGEGEGEGEGGEGEGDEDPLKGLETDGRKVDHKTRNALAKLAKVDPAAAKIVREAYFKNDTVMKETGAKSMSEAIQKIRSTQATIESLGGEAGIEEMQGAVADYRKEISQFQQGDPALIAQLYEANPEHTSNMAAATLEFLAAKDPVQFDNALVNAFSSRLEKANIPSNIAALAELIKEGKGQEAYDLTVKLGQWLDSVKAAAKKRLELKEAKNPEREALDREKQEFEQTKAKEYETKIGTDVNRMNNRALAKVVEPFFKDIKLSTEGRRDFINGLQSKIWNAMYDDKAFQRQASAIKKQGNAQKTAEFAHQKFNELLPDFFRRHRNANYPNYKPVKKPAPGTDGKGGNGAAPAARPQAGKVYTRSEVDIAGTPDVLLIVGKAYLKGTKTPVPYQRG